MERELILCVGMHRSGTSLTASLLQKIGVPLPGKLIGADVANPSGYFENRTIVDTQEELLRELGYWWPTEAASLGIPRRLHRSTAYNRYQKWLQSYLQEIFENGAQQVAIKDPRTSLLLPAWRAATSRLGITIKLIICLRQPRDVCWSLVWRDGPSVGMGWQRAQRLWLEHYRAILTYGQGLSAEIALYEHWLNPSLATAQLDRLTRFLDLDPTPEQKNTALEQVKPEFNHGGSNQLPISAWSLRLMHAALRRSSIAKQKGLTSSLMAQGCSLGLKVEQRLIRLRSKTQLLQLVTRKGRERLAPVFEVDITQKRSGFMHLCRYFRHFRRHEDPRPHPLISPAFLNQERRRCGLPPLRTAGEFLLHLLNADMNPINPHPWFDCRTFQQRSNCLGQLGEHPILTYLREDQQKTFNPYLEPKILVQLGAGRPLPELKPLPAFVRCLRPGLVLADAVQSLGDPSQGDPAVVMAHEAHWQALQDAFNCYPANGPDAPLNWFTAQGGLAAIARSGRKPAAGTSCWWLPGDWPALVLAELCGADPAQHRRFESAQTLITALETWQPEHPRPLIALTPALLAALLVHRTAIHPDAVILNLCWPEPDQQSAWLHLLAASSAVLECRPAVRTYLHSLRLPVMWPSIPDGERTPVASSGCRFRHLLLSLSESRAEQQLALSASSLDPQCYSAFLRLDAQLLSLDHDAHAPGAWLERMRSQHERWIWLTGPPAPADVRAWAIHAWAEQQGVSLQTLRENEQTWIQPFSRARSKE